MGGDSQMTKFAQVSSDDHQMSLAGREARESPRSRGAGGLYNGQCIMGGNGHMGIPPPHPTPRCGW